MNALVIGGTGPTGPGVVRGLLDRGYEVTIYHRGLHETDALPQVHHHLHGNADDRGALEKDLGGTHWDLVCVMYGREGRAEDVFAGRCDRFIYISGQAGNVRPHQLPFPRGRELPVKEDYPRYSSRAEGYGYAGWVAECERRVMTHHGAGEYAATVFTYANLYGPRTPRAALWNITKRLLDGRRQILVSGDGSMVRPMCFTENAAHQVLLAVDRREAKGQIFNSVDQQAFFLKDIIRIIAQELGCEVEVVGINHPYVDRLASSYLRSENWIWDASKLTYVLGYHDLVAPAEAVRRTVRWQVEHREEIDTPQLRELVPDPYAYDIEDQLIASYRAWCAEASRTIAEPPDLRRDGGERNFRSEIRPK